MKRILLFAAILISLFTACKNDSDSDTDTGFKDKSLKINVQFSNFAAETQSSQMQKWAHPSSGKIANS